MYKKSLSLPPELAIGKAYPPADARESGAKPELYLQL